MRCFFWGRCTVPDPLAGSGWGSDDAALDAAPDPVDLPAVISFSCPSNSLILWSQHPHLSLDSVKSRCQRSIVVNQEPQVSSCCKEPAPRPASMLLNCLLAHASPLHIFSNPSSFQNSQLLVFCFRDLLATTDLAQILLLLLESPCLGPDIERSRFWLLQRGEHDILCFAVPLQPSQSRRTLSPVAIHYFSPCKLPGPRSSPPFFPRINQVVSGWVRGGPNNPKLGWKWHMIMVIVIMIMVDDDDGIWACSEKQWALLCWTRVLGTVLSFGMKWCFIGAGKEMCPRSMSSSVPSVLVKGCWRYSISMSPKTSRELFSAQHLTVIRAMRSWCEAARGVTRRGIVLRECGVAWHDVPVASRGEPERAQRRHYGPRRPRRALGSKDGDNVELVADVVCISVRKQIQWSSKRTSVLAWSGCPLRLHAWPHGIMPDRGTVQQRQELSNWVRVVMSCVILRVRTSSALMSASVPVRLTGKVKNQKPKK